MAMKTPMWRRVPILLLLLVTWPCLSGVAARREVEVLLDVKAALDPQGMVLISWQAGGQACSGAFEGVLCDSEGRVSNISLQGRSLTGFIPDAVAELSALTGLFLHFNDLQGGIPASLSSLKGLTDLYLNWNYLSGTIPPQLGQLSSLQALELGCNDLVGEIPAELGALVSLDTLAINSNKLNGTLPASLGNMTMLTRLDVSNNTLAGTIPGSLADLSNLVFLDVSDNLLSGPVPMGLFGLQQGFIHYNNTGLCGTGVANISACPGTISAPSPTSPPTASSQRIKSIMSITTAIVFAIGGSAFLILVFICLRRRNAKLRQLAFESNSDMKSVIKPNTNNTTTANNNNNQNNSNGSSHSNGNNRGAPDESIAGSAKSPPGSFHGSTPDFSVLGRSRVMSDRSTSTIASRGLPSPAEWNSWIHLGELETATNYFSEKNLLRKKPHAAVYKGTLRDGTVVAVKAIYNTRFAIGEQDFQMAIEALMHVHHENIVKLLGFCCSKGGSECFLVYAFVPDRSLDHRLHGQCESSLSWSTRVKIIRGIAKGLAHLHEGLSEPMTVVHQNLWAGNVLLDKQGNALLADYGLSDIIAEEVMYATHKSLAALGYLAPEYTYTGVVTEDADIFAFGALVLELLTGHRPVFFIKTTRTFVSTAAWVKPLLELGKVQDFVDPKMGSRFSLAGAAGLAHIALQCMADDPGARPSMVDVVRRLHASEGWADMAIESFLFTAGTSAPGAGTLYAGRFPPFSPGDDTLHYSR